MWDIAFKYLKENMETIKKIPIPIILIFILMFFLTWYINGVRYEDRLRNKDSIISTKDAVIDQLKNTKHQIATPVRAVVIFDAYGNVYNKHGDSELIKDVHVVHLDKEDKLSELRISIVSSSYLDSIPLLTHSQEVIYLMKQHRGVGNEIIYELERTMHHGDLPALFKLEVY